MYSQRDIIFIPFPYSDLSDAKKRPALIVSNKTHNNINDDVICCAITKSPRNFPNSVEIEQSDLEKGTLYFKSRVKPSKIFTISKDKIIQVFGKLNINKSEEIVKELKILIEIDK